MPVTIAEICTDTETALGGIVTALGATILTHNYNEIKEGMPDYPLLEVYPEDLEVDSRMETDAHTLDKSGTRVHRLTVNVDVYVHTRNQIDENMEDVVDCWDAIEDRLEDTTTGAGCPIFNNEYIRNIHWTAERVTLVRQSLEYAGIRFVLSLEVF